MASSKIARPAHLPTEPTTQAILSWLVSLSLGWAHFRGTRILGNDSYNYLEQAKQFREVLPPSIGDLFAHGFSLLGSILMHLGLPAWQSLSLINCLSSLACIYTFSHSIYELPLGWRMRLASVLGLASIPFVFSAQGTLLSEHLFAALTCFILLALSTYPRRSSAVALTVLLPLLVATRYAGVFGILAVALFIARNFFHRRGLRAGIIQYSFSLLIGSSISALLLSTNYFTYGTFSPGDRGASGFSWHHFSDLGLSFLGLISTGLVEKLRDNPQQIGLAIGSAVIASVIALCVERTINPSNRFSIPCACLIISYILSIVAMRSIASFDDLCSSRFSYPILVPVAILLADFFSKSLSSKRLFAGLILIVIFSGMITAGKGVSAQLFGKVESAINVLNSSGGIPPQNIAVSEEALNASAYLQQKTTRAENPEQLQKIKPDIAIIASHALDRKGRHRTYEPQWLAFITQDNCKEGYSIERHDANVTIMRRCRPQIQPISRSPKNPS